MKAYPVSFWLFGYGLILIVCGIIGYASNPEKAMTALMSGGTFGTLSLIWGGLAYWGKRWALFGALFTLGFVLMAFIWRSTVSWMDYLGGDPAKRIPAYLISFMLVSTLVVLPRIIKDLRPRRMPSFPE